MLWREFPARAHLQAGRFVVVEHRSVVELDVILEVTLERGGERSSARARVGLGGREAERVGSGPLKAFFSPR